MKNAQGKLFNTKIDHRIEYTSVYWINTHAPMTQWQPKVTGSLCQYIFHGSIHCISLIALNLNVILVSWIQMRSTEYNFGLLNTNAMHWIILVYRIQKSTQWTKNCSKLLNIATKLLETTINNQKGVTMIMIRSRAINLHSFVLMNCFRIQNCCVQSIFATSMQCLQEAQIVKGFQVHPF